jgi:hypothetical protein
MAASFVSIPGCLHCSLLAMPSLREICSFSGAALDFRKRITNRLIFLPSDYCVDTLQPLPCRSNGDAYERDAPHGCVQYENGMPATISALGFSLISATALAAISD